MSIQKSNKLENRWNKLTVRSRFDRSKIKEIAYSSFVVLNNKSVNYPDYSFTNFLSDIGDVVKKQLLRKINNSIINLTQNFDNLFITNELHAGDAREGERAKFIINRYGSVQVEDIYRIKKCKLKEDKEIQFFFITGSENELKLVLIDVYHLCFSSDNRTKSGQVIKYDLPNKYHKVRNRNYCLSNLIKKTK